MLAAAEFEDAYLYVLGPIVVFLTVIAWIAMTLMASRNPRRPQGKDTGMPHRGPVQGGVIEGSPSQRTRRDPAPSVTHREVMRHIEAAREREAREREAREREAREREAREAGARAHDRRKGKRRSKLFRKRR